MWLEVNDRLLTSSTGSRSLTTPQRCHSVPKNRMGSTASSTTSPDADQCTPGCTSAFSSTSVAEQGRHRSTDSTASVSTVSSGGGSGSGWRWSGPPGDHSPYPVDALPYGGPQIMYCFVDMMMAYKILKNEINLGPSAVTTDIEKYMYLINDCYSEGFTLDKFVRVPGVKITTDVTNWTTPQPYQAILTKSDNCNGECIDQDNRWKLHVEKRVLSTKTVSFDQLKQDNDLLSTIHKYAAKGARLVCAESVGCVKSMSANDQYGIVGVELFFNVPLHQSPVQFTYHTVTVGAHYQIVCDATQTVQQVECTADFLGQLRLFLNTGWRLVDICIDSSAIARAHKMRVTTKLVETIWIFEKETSKLFDDTPLYEGVIIEYLHRVKVSRGKQHERPCRDWRPVIAGMGLTGWQLASIVQTPLLVQSSFTTYTMKLLFVFQRRLSHPRQSHNPHLRRAAGQHPITAPTTLWSQRDFRGLHRNLARQSRPGSAPGTARGDGSLPSGDLANGKAVAMAPASTGPVVGVRVSNATNHQRSAHQRRQIISADDGEIGGDVVGLYDEFYHQLPVSSATFGRTSAVTDSKSSTNGRCVRDRRSPETERRHQGGVEEWRLPGDTPLGPVRVNGTSGTRKSESSRSRKQSGDRRDDVGNVEVSRTSGEAQATCRDRERRRRSQSEHAT